MERDFRDGPIACEAGVEDGESILGHPPSALNGGRSRIEAPPRRPEDGPFELL